MLAPCIDRKPIEVESVLRTAPVLGARDSVLDALNQFKRHTAELAIVLAGEFPDEGE